MISRKANLVSNDLSILMNNYRGVINRDNQNIDFNDFTSENFANACISIVYGSASSEFLWLNAPPTNESGILKNINAIVNAKFGAQLYFDVSGNKIYYRYYFSNGTIRDWRVLDFDNISDMSIAINSIMNRLMYIDKNSSEYYPLIYSYTQQAIIQSSINGDSLNLNSSANAIYSKLNLKAGDIIEVNDYANNDIRFYAAYLDQNTNTYKWLFTARSEPYTMPLDTTIHLQYRTNPSSVLTKEKISELINRFKIINYKNESDNEYLVLDDLIDIFNNGLSINTEFVRGSFDYKSGNIVNGDTKIISKMLNLQANKPVYINNSNNNIRISIFYYDETLNNNSDVFNAIIYTMDNGEFKGISKFGFSDFDASQIKFGNIDDNTFYFIPVNEVANRIMIYCRNDGSTSSITDENENEYLNAVSLYIKINNGDNSSIDIQNINSSIAQLNNKVDNLTTETITANISTLNTRLDTISNDLSSLRSNYSDINSYIVSATDTNPLYGKKLIAFGDSICIGQLSYDEGDLTYNESTNKYSLTRVSFASYIAKWNNMQFKNYAVGGAVLTGRTMYKSTTDTTDDDNVAPSRKKVLDEIQEAYSDLQSGIISNPDYIILEGGINDSAAVFASDGKTQIEKTEVGTVIPNAKSNGEFDPNAYITGTICGNPGDTWQWTGQVPSSTLNQDTGQITTTYTNYTHNCIVPTTLDISTTCGGFERIVFDLLYYFPNARIVFVVPYIHTGHGGLATFAQNTIPTLLKACEKWSIPYVCYENGWVANELLPWAAKAGASSHISYGDRGGNIHPSSEGHRRIAKLVQAKLKTL